MRTVIVGAGPAGISAAAELAKRKPWEEIIMLSEDEFPYSRCMLHQYLSGERKEQQLSFTEADFMERRDINFRGKVKVSSVDIGKNRVLTDKGPVEYDKLLLSLIHI